MIETNIPLVVILFGLLCVYDIKNFKFLMLCIYNKLNIK